MALPKSYSREYAVSPSFSWSNSSQLTSGSKFVVSWETYNSLTQKYLPFNLTRIVNNGEDDIWFYPNQNESQKVFIPKGTIITMDKNFIPALSSFSIVHSGSTTISANKIILTSSKEGQDTDSLVSKLHKRLFGERIGGAI